MLQSLVASLDMVNIVVDGLDEVASDKEKATLLKELKKLPARVMIFSRPLQLHFRELPSATIFSMEARDQDIENFVISSLLSHPSLQNSMARVEDTLRNIAMKIRQKCRGM